MNKNNYTDAIGNRVLGSGGDDFLLSSQESSNESGGIYGDGNAISIWSAGDANGGQSAALVYFMDEDNFDNSNNNPYDTSTISLAAALKSYISPAGVYFQVSEKNKKENISKIENASEKIDAISGADKSEHSEMSNHANHTETPKVEVQEVNQLKAVFDNYFALKDALVKTDGNTASTKATSLLSAINAVKMETLKADEHTIWMKVLKNIKEDAEHIADTKDAKHQRDHFDTLSKNIYDLIKVSKQETPTYYQFCPMANNGKGANWLSKENVVKNPYYGSMMLSCGKVTETIK